MKSIRILVAVSVLVLLAGVPSFAQPLFEKIIGGEGDQFGSGVAVTPSGYVACGHTGLPGSLITDAWILAFDPYGDTLWSRTLGGPGIDEARSVILTGDTCLVFCGTFSPAAPALPDFYLFKMSLSGDTLWTRNEFFTSGAFGYSVAPADSGFILCGYVEQDRGSPRMALVRTDGQGDTLWTKTYGGDLSTAGFSAFGTDDGGFIACGYSDLTVPAWNRSTYVVRTDGNGDTAWTRTYPNPEYDLAWSIAPAAGGGYILTGYHDFTGGTGSDLYISRLSPDGGILWAKTYGQSGNDFGYSGVQTADGGFIFTGQSNVLGSEYQALYLVRTNAGGDTLWTRLLGDYPLNSGRCVRETPDFGYVIAGGTNSISPDGLYDLYLIKTDENGTITSSPSPAFLEPPFLLYPNPTDERFSILSDHPVLSVDLFDINGQPVVVEQVSSPDGRMLNLTLPSRCRGPFFVRVRTLQNQFIRILIVR